MFRPVTQHSAPISPIRAPREQGVKPRLKPPAGPVGEPSCASRPHTLSDGWPRRLIRWQTQAEEIRRLCRGSWLTGRNGDSPNLWFSEGSMFAVWAREPRRLIMLWKEDYPPSFRPALAGLRMSGEACVTWSHRISLKAPRKSRGLLLSSWEERTPRSFSNRGIRSKHRDEGVEDSGPGHRATAKLLFLLPKLANSGLCGTSLSLIVSSNRRMAFVEGALDNGRPRERNYRRPCAAPLCWAPRVTTMICFNG